LNLVLEETRQISVAAMISIGSLIEALNLIAEDFGLLHSKGSNPNLATPMTVSIIYAFFV